MANKQLNNSFAVGTYFQWGSKHLPDIWQNSQTFMVPGVAMSPIEISGRMGARIKKQPDSTTFASITIDFIIDREFQVYNDLYQEYLSHLDIKEGTFSSETFDMWLSVIDHNEIELGKWNFYNCRVEDIGEMMIDTFEDENLTLSISIAYDRYDFEKRTT